MNRLSAIVSVFLLLLCLTGRGVRAEELKGWLTISGAWAMYPTVMAWAEGFQRLHPGVRVDVSAGGAGKGAADVIAGMVDIGMVSRDPDPSEIARGVIPVYISHDAVFPVVSGSNPWARQILRKGIAKKQWRALYIDGTANNWGSVVKGADRPIHVYTRSDSCGAASAWAKYLDKKQEDLKGVGIYGDPGILMAVKRDPIGLGYSNFSYVFTRQGGVIDGVIVAPIDSNGNGIADGDEVIRDRASAVRSIKKGRYPVTRRNFFYISGKKNRIVRAFIGYALSDEGVNVLNRVGLSLPLPVNERKASLKLLK